MGEYADEYMRREVKSKFGFDIDFDSTGRAEVVEKVHCPKCGKRVKKAGLRDHMRVVHRITATKKGGSNV